MFFLTCTKLTCLKQSPPFAARNSCFTEVTLCADLDYSDCWMIFSTDKWVIFFLIFSLKNKCTCKTNMISYYIYQKYSNMPEQPVMSSCSSYTLFASQPTHSRLVSRLSNVLPVPGTVLSTSLRKKNNFCLAFHFLIIFCSDWPYLIRQNFFFSVSVFCSWIYPKIKFTAKNCLT